VGVTRVSKKRSAHVPGPPPAHFLRVMFHADGAVEMQVKVSDKAGIQAYGFAYSGVAVPMKSGSGKFYARRRWRAGCRTRHLDDPAAKDQGI